MTAEIITIGKFRRRAARKAKQQRELVAAAEQQEPSQEEVSANFVHVCLETMMRDWPHGEARGAWRLIMLLAKARPLPPETPPAAG